MLTEARAISEELGDTELRAEAMSWRVPAFVAIADIPLARSEVAQIRRMAEITRQPFNLHVAEHYRAAIALSDGELDLAEGDGAPVGAGGPHVDRARRLGHLRDPDVQPPSRAGTAGGARLGDQDSRGGERERRPWRPGLASLLAELGMESAAESELARIASEGLDPSASRCGSHRSHTSPTPASRWATRRSRELLYPELVSLAGRNVMVGIWSPTTGRPTATSGMLAGTLGEWERARRTFRASARANPAMEA